MSIVQTTDFQLNEALPIDGILGSALQKYIDKYERIILSRVLGYELYKEFNTAIAGGSPALKWTELRDGAEYTDTYLEYFEGVKDLAVDYIYFKFIQQNNEYSTSVGIKKVLTENSENITPNNKVVIAYNDMVDINEQLRKFIPAKNAESANTYENYREIEIKKINEFGA